MISGLESLKTYERNPKYYSESKNSKLMNILEIGNPLAMGLAKCELITQKAIARILKKKRAES